MTRSKPIASLLWAASACAGIFVDTLASAQWEEPAEYPSTGVDQPINFTLVEEPGDAGVFQEEDIDLTQCHSSQCDPYYYGGSRDLSWGCGGSPFRTGPGNCDDWRVGPVWDVMVDGMTLFREDADLGALEAATAFTLAGAPLAQPAELREQFDNSAGGRMFLTGLIPRYVGYQVQVGYEGIEEWNAAVVFPKVPASIAPAPTPPGGPPPVSERRWVNYRSSLHSIEMNVIRGMGSVWQPYGGIRFIRFADEIRDEIDQAASPPLPGDPPSPAVITSDRLNLFDIKNDLMGAQVGFRRDLWQLGRRFSLQGFFNAGVYYNSSKRTNTMNTTTTQFIADDTNTTDFSEARLDISSATNTVATERAELAYVTEASLSAVCRVNRCLALKGGYQVLWLGGLHTAQDAFLNPLSSSDDLLFQGWHVGAEYRR
jgi:hypothetical protein